MSDTTVAPETIRVFLSYSLADVRVAGEVIDLLREGVSDLEVWTPDMFVKPGDDWSRNIREALHDCDAVVFLVTRHSASSTNVGIELGAAWGLGKRIVAIKAEDEIDLPVQVRGIQYVALTELRKHPRRLAGVLRRSARR